MQYIIILFYLQHITKQREWNGMLSLFIIIVLALSLAIVLNTLSLSVVLHYNILHQIIPSSVCPRGSRHGVDRRINATYRQNRHAVTHETSRYVPDTPAKKRGLALWETRGMDTVG